MTHIIKLTNEQLDEVNKTYLSGSDVAQFNGQTEISATGKLSQTEYGKPKPKDVGDILTPQTPFSMRKGLVTRLNCSLRENDIKYDKPINNKNIEPEDTKDLQPENNQEDPQEEKVENFVSKTTIPETIKFKLELFLREIGRMKLQPKQRGALMKQIIDALPQKGVPYDIKKYFIERIRNNTF